MRAARAVGAALTLAGLLGLSVRVGSAPDAAVEKRREFRFTYEAKVKGLQKGQAAQIWLPAPPANEDQLVRTLEEKLPAPAQIAREPKYGNPIIYLKAQADDAGQIKLALTYLISRREVQADLSANVRDQEDVDLFLQPDAKVPVGGKPLVLLQGRELPADRVQVARVLYDVVNRHMTYDKQRPGWGRGDAEWACDSKYGNCTDFHSLFISLARSQRIAARFEIGFALPEKRGQGEIAGYHCWAQCKPAGKGWLPVDIAEANQNPQRAEYCFGNLSENRVTFSVGRDLVLTPKQEGPPLNFFIYPYVEVDRKPWPEDQIERRFSYHDLAGGG